MLSCLSSFIREISRMAVEGVPSSESRWISFRATISPVWRLRPLKTWSVLAVRSGSGRVEVVSVAGSGVIGSGQWQWAAERDGYVSALRLMSTYGSICSFTELGSLAMII